jgi:hypothetical protein
MITMCEPKKPSLTPFFKMMMRSESGSRSSLQSNWEEDDDDQLE